MLIVSTLYFCSYKKLIKTCDNKETRKSILQQHDGNKYIFELFQYKASQKDCLDIGDKSWKLIKTYRKLIKLIGKLLKLIGNLLELIGNLLKTY